MTTLDLAVIERMMEEAGESWAISHAQRLLALVERIGVGLNYDRKVLTWAAYLHDWGAFRSYRQPNVDHATRSAQVAAAEILPSVDLADTAKGLVLEAIALHDYRDLRPVASVEALLLREADFLDLLGVVGIAREFAWGPNDLDACYRRILGRRDAIRGRFTIPAAQQLAAERLARMEICLQWFVEESSCNAHRPTT